MRRSTLPLLLVACLPFVENTRACAPVVPPGSFAQVADESAIIIWDAKTKTQHFIRRATFLTSAPNLGFLVPAPKKPTIEPASDEAFKHLEKVTEPKTVERVREVMRYKKGYYGGPSKSMGAMPAGAAVPSPAVRVLGEGRVGHLDYAILEADKTAALQEWLEKHGYAFREDLKPWLQGYIDAKWTITAFKFARDAKAASSEGVATTALRMTFTADQPFFPYSEPVLQRTALRGFHEPRLLRIYFLGEERVGASLADGNFWRVDVPWSNTISSSDRDILLDHLKLPANAVPASDWLTEFQDISSPRNGSADLLFTPNAGAGGVTRPEIIVEVDPPAPPGAAPLRSLLILGGIAGGILLLLIVASFVFWRSGPEPSAA